MDDIAMPSLSHVCSFSFGTRLRLGHTGFLGPSSGITLLIMSPLVNPLLRSYMGGHLLL